jgi:hypothetical protein
MNPIRVNATGVKRFPVLCCYFPYPTSKITMPRYFKRKQNSIQLSGTAIHALLEVINV